jgi:hypothetical protein
LIERYLRQGPAGLEERSRRPHVSPNRTDDEIVAAILEARRHHPNWGGKKLLALLQKRHRDWELPHRQRRALCDQHLGARLSKLSAWWVRLGVPPGFIEPGKPQQNGRHERMHRTLKDETTRPASASLPAQQRRFNTFRTEFNNERPHEALDQQTPASLYRPLSREMLNKLPPLVYSDRFEVRYVSRNGGIRWKRGWVNVSTVCIGEYVGLEGIDDGIWNVYFGPLKLGRLLDRHMKIEDAYGQLLRHSA